MSDLASHIDFTNAYARNLRVLNKRRPVYELPYGVKATDYRNLTSAITGNAGTQYQVFCNDNQVISDYMLEVINFTVTMNVANGGTQPILPFAQGNFAPRCLPIESVTQTSQLTVNGTPITYNGQNTTLALMSFNRTPEIEIRDLPCSRTDTYAALIGTQVGNAAGAAPAYSSVIGSIKNQLLDYATTTYGGYSRFSELIDVGFTQAGTIAAGANANVSIQFTVQQPIITGATALSLTQESGFVGATNIQFNRTFISNMGARLIELYGGAGATTTISNIMTAVNSATLYYSVFTALDSYRPEYPIYYPVTDYSTQSITLASPVTTYNTIQISSQTLQLDRVPRAVYVWVSVPVQNKLITDSDAFAFQITNLSLTFNGVGGQFSGMSEYQLYQRFCAAQGYDKSFAESTIIDFQPTATSLVGSIAGGYGTCLRIDASELSGIPWETVSVGTGFNCNLSIQVTAKNLSPATVTPSLFIQVVHDAMLAITSPTSSQLYKAILSPGEVEHIRKSKPYEFSHAPLVGGNFFTKVWDGIKDGAKYAWDHKGDIMNVAKSVAPLVGLGKHPHAKPMHHKGGAKVTKAALQKRLKGHGLELSESEDECDY